jgi:hypothetical protein
MQYGDRSHMTDRFRELHEDVYSEWKEDKADEFAAEQRRAFIAGFEAAASESQNFNCLVEWLEKERDEAHEEFEETDDDQMFARYLAFIDVLVKIDDIGCAPNDETEPGTETEQIDRELTYVRQAVHCSECGSIFYIPRVEGSSVHPSVETKCSECVESEYQ